MITKKEIELSVSGVLGAAATPAAVLPNELQEALNKLPGFPWHCGLSCGGVNLRGDEGSIKQATKWMDLHSAYPAIRRELDNEITRLRQQLAESERVCGELRAENERMGAEISESAQIIGAAICELAGEPSEGLHIGHLPQMCAAYVEGSRTNEIQLEEVCNRLREAAK